MLHHPTLCDLAGIAVPKHLEGKSIRPLFNDPKTEWSAPGVTTYRFKNHTARTEDWRLATDPKFAEQKAKLAKMLPDHDHADIGGADRKGAENSGDGKKAEKKRLKKEAK